MAEMYGQTVEALEQSNGNRFAGDSALAVRFYKHPRRNEEKSKEEGRPIFEEVDYIEIVQPGNKDSIVKRPVMEMDKERFADGYRRFLERQDQDVLEGTPLEEWPAVTRSQVEELRYVNIRTVEQLAAISDSNAQQFMGLKGLKTKAVKFIESARDEATAEALAEANEKMAKMQEQLDKLIVLQGFP